MATLPTNRTTANTPDQHVADHNEIHRLHDILDGSTAPSSGSALPSWIQHGNGIPLGLVTPAQKGALYQDTLNGTLYVAVAATSADWILIGGWDGTASKVGLSWLNGVFHLIAAAGKGVYITDAAGVTTGNGLSWNTTNAIDGSQVLQIQTGLSPYNFWKFKSDGGLLLPGGNSLYNTPASPSVGANGDWAFGADGNLYHRAAGVWTVAGGGGGGGTTVVSLGGTGLTTLGGALATLDGASAARNVLDDGSGNLSPKLGIVITNDAASIIAKSANTFQQVATVVDHGNNLSKVSVLGGVAGLSGVVTVADTTGGKFKTTDAAGGDRNVIDDGTGTMTLANSSSIQIGATGAGHSNLLTNSIIISSIDAKQIVSTSVNHGLLTSNLTLTGGTGTSQVTLTSGSTGGAIKTTTAGGVNRNVLDAGDGTATLAGNVLMNSSLTVVQNVNASIFGALATGSAVVGVTLFSDGGGGHLKTADNTGVDRNIWDDGNGAASLKGDLTFDSISHGVVVHDQISNARYRIIVSNGVLSTVLVSGSQSLTQSVASTASASETIARLNVSARPFTATPGVIEVVTSLKQGVSQKAVPGAAGASDAVARLNKHPRALAEAASATDTVIRSGVLASDAFARTVGAGGWGSANNGGAWSVPTGTASFFSVSSNTGRVALDSSAAVQAIQLASATALTASIQFDVSFSALPSGGNFVFAFAWFRVQGGGSAYYRIGVFVDSAGVLCLRGEGVPSVTLFPDSTPVGFPTVTPGMVITVGAELSTNNMTTGLAKAFQAGTADPGWLISGTDLGNVGPQLSGPIGMRFSSTADPITVSVDNFIGVIV